MTEYLEKLILDNWEKWANGEKPRHLDFLKTHAGNATRNKKVGFFIFNGKQPFIFVKTVRENNYNSVIDEEFESLKNAHQQLKNGSVPIPIHAGEYQGVSFSLEEAFVGKQFHSFKKEGDLKRFLVWFFGFQKSMVLGRDLSGKDLGNYFEDIVDRFLKLYSLDDNLRNTILDLARELAYFDGLKLPLIGQHGDLTPDNVLDCGGKIKVIDWGNFKKIDLPLFDLLVFLQRWSSIRDIGFIHKYRPIIDKYLEEFNIDKNLLKRLIFVHYLLDFMRKKEQLEAYDKEYLNQRLKEIKDII